MSMCMATEFNAVCVEFLNLAGTQQACRRIGPVRCLTNAAGYDKNRSGKPVLAKDGPCELKEIAIPVVKRQKYSFAGQWTSGVHCITPIFYAYRVSATFA